MGKGFRNCGVGCRDRVFSQVQGLGFRDCGVVWVLGLRVMLGNHASIVSTSDEPSPAPSSV